MSGGGEGGLALTLVARQQEKLLIQGVLLLHLSHILQETSLGDEEDGEEGREEEETPERSVLGYRAAIIAAHDGGRPGDGGGAPMGADPDPELENG